MKLSFLLLGYRRVDIKTKQSVSAHFRVERKLQWRMINSDAFQGVQIKSPKDENSWQTLSRSPVAS